MWLKLDCPSFGGGHLTLFSYASPNPADTGFSVGYQCPDGAGTASLVVTFSTNGAVLWTLHVDDSSDHFTDGAWHHLGVGAFLFNNIPMMIDCWSFLDGNFFGEGLEYGDMEFPSCPGSGGSVILGQGQSGYNTLDARPDFDYTVFMTEVRLWWGQNGVASWEQDRWDER